MKSKTTKTMTSKTRRATKPPSPEPERFDCKVGDRAAYVADGVLRTGTITAIGLPNQWGTKLNCRVQWDHGPTPILSPADITIFPPETELPPPLLTLAQQLSLSVVRSPFHDRWTYQLADPHTLERLHLVRRTVEQSSLQFHDGQWFESETDLEDSATEYFVDDRRVDLPPDFDPETYI